MPQARRIMLYDANKKNTLAGYLLCLLFGCLGAHRFYLGQFWFGAVYILASIAALSALLVFKSLWVSGILALIILFCLIVELFIIPSRVRAFNHQLILRLEEEPDAIDVLTQQHHTAQWTVAGIVIGCLVFSAGGLTARYLMPIYQERSIHEQVFNMMTSATPAIMRAHEYIMTSQGEPPPQEVMINLLNVNHPYVKDLRMTERGEMILSADASALKLPDVNGERAILVIKLTPEYLGHTVVWHCTAIGNSIEYAPPDCR